MTTTYAIWEANSLDINNILEVLFKIKFESNDHSLSNKCKD